MKSLKDTGFGIFLIFINVLLLFFTDKRNIIDGTAFISTLLFLLSVLWFQRKQKSTWKIILLPIGLFFIDILVAFLSDGNSSPRSFVFIFGIGLGAFIIQHSFPNERYRALMILVLPSILLYSILPLSYLSNTKLPYNDSLTPFFLSPLVGLLLAFVIFKIDNLKITLLPLLLIAYLYSFPLYEKVIPLIIGGKQMKSFFPLADTPSFSTQDGRQLSLKDIKEDIVILDLWFYGCGPCEKGFPKLEKLHKKYENDPNVFISTVRYFPGKENGEIDGYQHLSKYSFNKMDFLIPIQDQWGESTFPVYLVFDKNRKLRYKGSLIIDSPQSNKDIENIIASLKK